MRLIILIAGTTTGISGEAGKEVRARSSYYVAQAVQPVYRLASYSESDTHSATDRHTTGSD